MEIKQKIYSELSPKQRAIAAFLSVNRDDSDEIDRLFASAPRNAGHGQAILAIGQALDSYNRFLPGAVCNYLITSGRLDVAISYCSAWLDAGGALGTSKYLENLAVIERLKPIVEKMVEDVCAVRQATREWCEKNQIPVDVFAQPLCLFPLPDRVETVSNSEELIAIRSCFDKITLSW
jgi:hypothetical protein